MRLSFIIYFILVLKVEGQEILPGAYQTQQYFSLLKDKRVAVFANHTSIINQTHLIDTLLQSGIQVTKIFAPEHGFRGKEDAGKKLSNEVDDVTKIPIISLYGKKLKPSKAELSDVDILVFDIQDVGARFYTFISSLEYFSDAAIENDKPLIILDRPNPNGFYVDGPILENEYKSFVGMQAIPIVYGMTIGEYAKMLIGEKWLDWKNIRKIDDRISLGELLGFEKEKNNFSLTIIPCKNYTHKSLYQLPIPPSPNLPNMQSIYWYPTTCLFEGTVLSEGRGTDYPFCIFGHPSFSKDLFKFKPISKSGATNPKFVNQDCYGWNVFKESIHETLLDLNKQIQIKYLINAYQLFSKKDEFFIIPKSEQEKDYFFNKLAGSNKLLNQIKQNKSADEIRKSWQQKITTFKKIRKKYLLYKDFE
jgi:uncharacterized protein YbbC (DUF1343 family)